MNVKLRLLFQCTTLSGLAAAQIAPFPSILNVTENAAGTLITIDGNGFGKAAPKVMLDGAPLVVTTSTNTKVIATLPSGLAAGAYLLTVDLSAFEVVIGPAGPTGRRGSRDPQGPRDLPDPRGRKEIQVQPDRQAYLEEFSLPTFTLGI